MDNNPIKYSDLIQPDDSIENLIKQLDEANEAYNNIGNSIKAEAQRISAAMNTISGATKEGRDATRGYSEDAQKLLKAERDLNFARSETARRIAELKAMKKDEQTITKLTVQLNRSAEGSYEALSAQYGLNKIRLNAMTQAEREGTDVGRKLEAETAAIYDKMNQLQKATGKYTLQVGNYELATKNLTQQLKEYKMQLA
jgi:chromosome segregation ATPase